MANSYPLSTFISQLQSAFSAKGMTLPADTASAWVRSEQTVTNGNIIWNSNSAAALNNPLGLGWNGSTWNQYSSFNQAAQAYAQTVATSSYYTNIKNALSSKSVTDASAAQAIASSPWAGPNGYEATSPIRQFANANGAPPHGGVSNGAATNQGAISGAANPPAPNSTQSQGLGAGLIPDIQSAVTFVGVILVGLAFIIGAFLLSGKDKSQVVII